MTWGKDTDEHEARDQLIAFCRGRRHPDRHRRRLHRRRVRGAARLPARRRRAATTWCSRPRPASGAGGGERTTDTSRGRCSAASTPRCERLGVDHVDLWQVHIWSDEAPLEETLAALDQAVSSGRATYVGISNYTGWQTAQAATWQRAAPGRAPLASTQVEYSLVNRDDRARGGAGARRARPRASCPGRRWAAASSPASTAPASPVTRAPRPRSSRPSSSATSTTAAAASSRPSSGPPTASSWTPLEVALAWVRDRPGVTAPIVGARTAAQLKDALGVEDKELPPEIRAALDDVSEPA